MTPVNTSMLKAMFYDVFGLNHWLFYLINRDYGAMATKFIRLADVAGDYVDAPFYFVLFVIIAAVHTRLKKGEPTALIFKQKWKCFIASFVLAVITSAVVIYGLKSLLFMPRPFLVLPPESVHTLGGVDQNVLAHTSFPSGHSGFAAALVFSIWFYADKFARAALVGLLVFAMWARIAAGVHFPIDVVVGALIGCFAAILSHSWTARLNKKSPA